MLKPDIFIIIYSILKVVTSLSGHVAYVFHIKHVYKYIQATKARTCIIKSKTHLK